MKNQVIIILCLAIFVACENEVSKVEPSFNTEIAKISAPSLEGNLLNIDTVQRVKVFLPPNYFVNTEAKYPVMYYLHGFSETLGTDHGILDAAYDEMLEEAINEFIIVKVNYTSKFLGTFAVNSLVNGNWEDYITNEVVEYIDENFRTIADKKSRAIAGFSMGGFGALYLGLRHPDLYNVSYAISPGVLIDTDINRAFLSWSGNNNFKKAYGAAFSPNLDLAYPYAEIPKFDDTDADNAIVERWIDGFGHFDQKVENYLSGDERLKMIALDYGTGDSYSWIPRGCIYLAELLEEKGIAHENFKGTGGHDVYAYNVAHNMLPLLSENLVFED